MLFNLNVEMTHSHWLIQIVTGALTLIYLFAFQRFFAGPRVVSRTISYQSIKQITRIFQRQPIIWDNYHANDYDRRRIYLGPYSGRHSDIVGITKGVLTNPNCQFESNFVAIHTLSAWRAAFKEKTTDSEPIEVQINPIASDDQVLYWSFNYSVFINKLY